MFSDFLLKKLMIVAEMIFFQGKIPFDTHCRTNLPPLEISGKSRVFFRINHLFFLKKNGFWNVLRNFTISTANLLQFSQKVISGSVA